MALPPGRVRGKCPDAARLRYQVGGGQCRCCGSFLDPQLEHAETCSTLPTPREDTTRALTAVVCGLKLADTGITTGTQRAHSIAIRLADIFTTAAVPGRGAALGVCVASPNAASARAPHYRPLVWTADGRSHPVVTRTLQHAADIASSRNGQQMSASARMEK